MVQWLLKFHSSNWPLAKNSITSHINEKAAGADIAVVTKAVSSGTFAYQPATGENFLLRMAGDNAEKINGVSSDVLAVGGVANEYNWDGVD